MPQFISPGVYTLEKDLSQYVTNLSSTIVAMVGTSEMGPTETPTLVTSANQFVSLFGQQNPNHYLGYAALSYLEQGHQLYVTRVAPADAKLAKVTVPVPVDYPPYTGDWSLYSNTTTTATFKITNTLGKTGAEQMVILPSADTTTKLPGFDIMDSTDLAKIQGKVGSDLNSFVTSGLASKYVVGRSFSVNTGYGRGVSVPVTAVASNDTTSMYLTVDSTKFSTYNSPTTSAGTGSIVCKTNLVSGAIANETFTIGKTYNGFAEGSVILVLTATGTPNATPSSSDINGYVAVTGTSPAAQDVTITIPMFYTGTGGTGTITAPNAADNALAIYNTLNGLVTLLSPTVAPVASNLNLAWPICRVSYNGIFGVGYVNPVDGTSYGYKSATIGADSVTVSLAAITLGASANFSYGTNTGPWVSTTDMGLYGTFSLSLSRPVWKMSLAGTANYVPTLLKFSSLGQADFSNIAITVDLNKATVNSAGEQEYLVKIFARNTALTVPTDSVIQNDFTLLEKWQGNVDTLQSSINAEKGGSAYVNLKIDYTTEDSLDMATGVVTPGLIDDKLNVSFGLITDASGLGVISGAESTTVSNVIYQAYSAFLAGGKVGSAITKYDIIGDVASKTGIWSVSDPEKIDINLLVVPGWSADPDVAHAMISLCDLAAGGRGDCMCILDTPFGLSVQDVINYRNNVLQSGSNYAAIYYPWVQVNDPVNKLNIFVPPSGMVAGQYSYNDYIGAVYTAPAGRNRGVLANALSSERILNQGDRDVLTLAQINPLHTEAGIGVYIRGQMTLQQATTALNRVNVRRLLLYLRKVIATASKYFEFEPGDAVTALRLQQLAASTLTSYQNLGAIRSYTVDVGPDVNTAQVLENNELQMKIGIVPTKTAEIIIETFNILPQGQGITINNA